MAEPSSPTTPARKVVPVTPHASNDLPGGICKSLWVNDNGVVAIAVVAELDTDPVVMTCAGPCLIPVRAKAIRVTGTTATDIDALY